MPNRPSAESATLRVEALGTFEIRGADGQPVPAGRQPKRQAILLYLLTARPHGIHRRDSVIGVFWPDSPRERGSHALSQALNWLERELGVDVTVRPGADELGIDERLVTCDAREFTVALAAGDYERALELYRGELAPGLSFRGGGEFERWLTVERRHLGVLAAEAAEILLERARQRGDDAAALQWARRWQQLDAHSEEAVRAELEVHADRGDTAAAIVAYDDFAKRLAEDLDLAPSPDTAEWVAQLRRENAAAQASPERAAVATLDPSAAVVPEPVPAADPGPTPMRRATAPVPLERGRPRIRAIAVGVVMVVLAVIAGRHLLEDAGGPVTASAGDPRIAVMFFSDDSQEGDLGPVAAGMSVALRSELASLEGLDVVSTAAMRPFRGMYASLDTLRDLFQVRWIIDGSVSVSGDMYRVSVEFIDALTGLSRPIPLIERPREELFGLIDAIVREVSEELRELLGREIRYEGWKAGTSQAAWLDAHAADKLRIDAESEARGEDRMRLLERADSLAAQAIDADRRWVEGWVLRGRIAGARAILELPDAEAMRRRFAQALAYTDSALERGNDAGAFEQRGSLLLHMYLFMPPADADSADALLAAAEENLERALDIDPRRPLALARLAQNHARQGRFDEAFEAGRRARRVDVFLERSHENAMNMFTYAFHMGDDDEAANYCDEVSRLAPDSHMLATCRLDLLAWGEQTAQTLRLAEFTFEFGGAGESEDVRARNRPVVAMKFAAALARAGETDKARDVMEEWRDRGGVAGDLRELEAAVWVALGEPDTAIALLRRVVEARPASRSRILAMRFFRDIAHHPEFRALAGAPAPAGH